MGDSAWLGALPSQVSGEVTLKLRLNEVEQQARYSLGELSSGQKEQQVPRRVLQQESVVCSRNKTKARVTRCREARPSCSGLVGQIKDHCFYPKSN